MRMMSRPKRWSRAVLDARQALSEVEGALETLKEIQEEYQEWRDNIPEGLEESPVVEKLDAVVEIDLEMDSWVEDTLDELESVDLPLGFGRD